MLSNGRSMAVGAGGRARVLARLRAAPATRKEHEVAVDRKEAVLATLSKDTARTLVRVVRVMYPHDRFPDGPYERVVEKLDSAASEDATLAGLLAQGVRDLDAAGGKPFTELDEEAALAALRSLEATPFFASVRGTAVVALYDQHDVWEILGYEGPSFDAGGYLSRGFDDLDWLPDPPIE
jgi:hypothetical protein